MDIRSGLPQRALRLALLIWLHACAGLACAQGIFELPVQVIVTDPVGKPVSGASVVMQGPSPDAQNNLRIMRATTNDKGVVELQARIGDPARFEFEASLAGYKTARGSLDLGPDDRTRATRIELTLGRPNETVLLVTARNKLGESVFGATVSVAHTGMLLTRAPDYTGTTGADGVARIAVQPGRYTGEGLLGTELQLTIEHVKYRTTRHSVQLNYRTPIPEMKVPVLLLSPEESGDNVHGMPIAVLVVDDSGERVPGARVIVRVDDNDPNLTREQTTDDKGEALIEVTVMTRSSVQIDASKSNYRSGRTRFAIDPKDRGSGVIEAGVTMTKLFVSETEARIAVKVMNARDRTPVSDARVRFVPLTAEAVATYPRGVTGTDGVATLNSSAKGRYRLEVTQDGFEPYRSDETLERRNAEFDVWMTERAGVRDDSKVELTVTASDRKDARGRSAPIPGARVIHGSASSGTDENGKATITFSGQLGVELRVEAAGYRPKSARVTGGRYLVTREHVLNVQLDPADANEDTPIQLTIRVVDAAGSDQPIGGASVRLLSLSGGQLGPVQSIGVSGCDPQKTALVGETYFRFVDAAARAARAGLIAEVSAPGYTSSRTEVPASMLKPNKDCVTYVVVLDSIVRAQLNAIGSEVARLEALRTDVQARLSAAAVEAENARLAADDAVSTARNWENALAPDVTTGSGQQARSLMILCKALLDVTDRIERDGDARSRTAIDLLEKAERGARSCTSVAQADAALASYSRGAVEVQVMLAEYQKARIESDRFARGVASFRQGVLNYSTLLRDSVARAELAAKKAEQAMQGVAAWTGEIASGRARLSGQLDALRLRAGLTPLNVTVIRSLDGRLKALGTGMGEVQSDVAARGHARRAATASNVIGRQYEGYEGESCVSVRKRLPEVVNNFEANWTAAGVALRNLQDLPARVDACRRNAIAAAAPPLVEVPDLSGVPNNAMAAALQARGLTWGGVTYVGQAAAPNLAYRWADQNPKPYAQVPRGTPVTVFMWQEYKPPAPPPPVQPPVVTPATPPAAATTVVPNLSLYATRAQMEAAISAAGLVPGFTTPLGATPPGMEGRLAVQWPAANERVNRGLTVSFSIYPAASVDPRGAPLPTTPVDPRAKAGGVPDVIGDSLERAQSKLEAAGLRVGGIERGARPPTPDWAERIYFQSPPKGSALPGDRSVALRQYGSVRETGAVVPSGPGLCLTGEGPIGCTGTFVGVGSLACDTGHKSPLQGTLTLRGDGAAELQFPRGNGLSPFVVAGKMDSAGRVTVSRTEGCCTQHRWDAQFGAIAAGNGARKASGGGRYEVRSRQSSGPDLVCTAQFNLQ